MILRSPALRSGLFVHRLLVLVSVVLTTASVVIAGDVPPGTSLASKVTWIDQLPIGPFVRRSDQSLLTVDGTDVLTSRDEGRTWQRAPLFREPEKYLIRIERALIRTRAGTLILAFANDRERTALDWDKAAGEPGPEARLPTYVTRSLDDGRTWETPVKLHDDWTGAIRDIAETPQGSVVFTTMRLLRRPGRHASLTYRSDDEGASWKPSNLIDLGGQGHHDGALEPTLVPLRDGRLWMLIRTTLDYFHQAWSDDDGRTWRKLAPTNIDAATAPGLLKRLSSGRLLLVWNRLYPEGQTSHPRRDDRNWSARPAINQRAELSIAFSDDDGRTWTRPAVIVRAAKADTSYPYVFEPRPGSVWITTMRGTVRVQLREEDFLTPEKPYPSPNSGTFMQYRAR